MLVNNKTHLFFHSNKVNDNYCCLKYSNTLFQIIYYNIEYYTPIQLCLLEYGFLSKI